MKQQTLCIVCTFIGIIVGFICGRKNSNTEQSIQYIKGETIEKVVEISVPYKVEIPSKPIYIYKQADTIFSTHIAEIDTAAILSDWIAKRSYKHDLFDNQHGKLSIDASVQYNKLNTLTYSFTPIHKEITSIKKPVWTPYLSASYSTLNEIGIGGGVFYHDIGIGARYVTDFNKKGFALELKCKF